MVGPVTRSAKLARNNRLAYLPAAVVAIGFFAGGYYMDRDNARASEAALRFSIAEKVASIRSRLEGNINSTVQLMKGIAASISYEPEMNQAKFEALAEPLVTEKSLLHNIDYDPNLIIRLLYPIKGNEKAIGLNFRDIPDQKEAAERAMNSDDPIMNGPVELVQGGEGLIGRIRVLRRSVTAGQDNVLGLISAVIHTDMLYNASGFNDRGLSIEISIRGKDGLGEQGAVFYGRGDVFSKAPVLTDVTLPSGRWQIAAIPSGGWPTRPHNAWILRLVLFMSGAFIVLPVAVIGWFFNKRRADNEELRWNQDTQHLAAQAAGGFLVTTNPDEAFSRLLEGIINITHSKFGLLGHVMHDDDGKVYFMTRAITDLSWDDATRALFLAQYRSLDSYNVETVFGHTLRTGEVELSDNPRTDPRSDGLPPGHPALHSYLGVPLHFEGRMVGMVGIANRPGGYDQQLVERLGVVWAACGSILHAANIAEHTRRSDERIRILSKAVDASPSLVMITDNEGRIQYVNPRFSEVTGYTLEEVQGKTPSILKSGKKDRAGYEEVWRIIKSGHFWRGEMHNRKKDGTHFDADVAIAPIVNDVGLITHYVSLQEDVTEKRQAREDLAENERRFREMVEAAGIAFHFYSLTPDGRYQYASPNCLDWFGLDQDSIFDKNWVEVAEWSADSIEQKNAVLRQCFAGADPIPVPMEYTRNNKVRYLICYPHLVMDTSGEIVKLEGVSVDITERIILENKLRLAVEAAENANRAKSEFLSNMSHELRTPLNAVIGFAQILEHNPKELLSPSQRKCVDRILSGGHHLLELINEILDLAKIESGQVELTIENIVLSDLMEECRSYVDPLAQALGISLTITPCPGVTVRADRTRLRQVLLNLFSNATKYNRPSGKIDVSGQPSANGAVTIVVADTGIGIPEDKRDQLFRPFSRLGQENSGIEGTGIGLTITKRLVEGMGGSIDFESIVCQGTTFYVRLPSSNIVPDAVEPTLRRDRPLSDGLSGTVVYVEDNPANIELMEMVFSGLDGVKLMTASSGELGIELIKRKRPDLIILDLNLPGMDGFQILHKLRQMEESMETPVIALTASATQRDIERGRVAGFDRYLTKPFAVDILIATMREVIEERRLH